MTEPSTSTTPTKRKYLSKDAREIVCSVYNYLKKHHTSGNLLDKVSKATTIPRSTAARIITEGRKIEAGEVTVFRSRALHNDKPSPKSIVDDCAEEVIRRTIHNFHILKKQRRTVKAIYNEIKDDVGINFSGKISSFRKLLKRMGFRWRKTTDNRPILMEQQRIRELRCAYIRAPGAQPYRENLGIYKTGVALRNVTFHLADVEKLTREKFEATGAEEWAKVCDHVIKIEQDYIQKEHILDEYCDV